MTSHDATEDQFQIVRIRQGFDDDEVIMTARPLCGGPEDFVTAPLDDHPHEGSIITRDQFDRFNSKRKATPR